MNLKSDVVWLKKKIYFMQESEGGQGDLDPLENSKLFSVHKVKLPKNKVLDPTPGLIKVPLKPHPPHSRKNFLDSRAYVTCK